MNARHPNVVFVFADQMRAQATGYAGNGDVRTPCLDRLAGESVNFVNALAGAPVCSPYRASLLTGQRPLTHGVFINDIYIGGRATSIAQAFRAGGYATGYIGKWHVDGHGREAYIPPERRLGFEHWQVLECTHDYNHSPYYEGDSAEKKVWPGYDAIAQTRAAQQFIRSCARGEQPFLLMLSWGPPHNPFETAPERYRALFEADRITLRPNVPPEAAEQARRDLAGYYAHIAALDDCLADLLGTLDETGVAEDTIFVFTSDHGDMIGSHGMHRKQKPYEESIRVPFLLRWPGGLGRQGRQAGHLIDAQDIMPTLLSLSGLAIPETVEGRDLSGAVRGEQVGADEAALLQCIVPFGEFKRRAGGREYRGLRTLRHTYVRSLAGPWLLFDNDADPYQLHNLVDEPSSAELVRQLDARLAAMLTATGDEFLPAETYIARWGHVVDADLTASTMK